MSSNIGAQKIYRTFGDMSGDLRRVQEEIAAIQEEITRRDDKFAARIENAGDEYLQLAQRKADTAGWTTGELAGLEFQQKVLLQLEAEGIKLSAEKLELIEKQRAEMNRAMIEHERRETLALDVNAWLTRCLGGDDAKTFRLDAGAVTLSPLARLEALFEHRLNDTTDMQAEVDALTEKLSRTRRQLSKARTATKARVRQPRA